MYHVAEVLAGHGGHSHEQRTLRASGAGRNRARVDHAGGGRAAFNADVERTDWHDGALWFMREKRDAPPGAVPEWEELRALASAIKEHALSRLAEYLEQFEANAIANGMHVHWARDADEHNQIVHGILRARGVARLVKSKSMLTEECGLNPYLEARGIEVVDTDLGERIVQLRERAAEPHRACRRSTSRRRRSATRSTSISARPPDWTIPPR